LVEALDEETGVGFSGRGEVSEASLLEDIDLSPHTERSTVWGPRESWLLGRVTEALARGDQELTLTDRDVEQLAEENDDPLPLPDAFAVLARLEADSDEAVARGDFRLFLGGVSGPSGARLLSRFCHADLHLADHVAEHLRAEEALRPEALFAEIVHLPESRLGNILARPAFRTWEVPYLGRSSVPAERQLPLDDLRVSVEGQRVRLRSARLGREIVPRLTSAHAFAASPGVYGFLCALQGQGVAGALAWDWGPLVSSAFLPRVVCGRLVLARARWRVPAALLAPDADEQFVAFTRWRQERRLPRWVCLTEFDRELPFDLDNTLMAETFLGQIKGREQVVLTEWFPAPDHLCARGPDGRFVHELIVPFIRKEAAGKTKEEGRRPATLPPLVRRSFLPGSEWLTMKVYAGSLAVDHLVREGVGPLAAEWEAAGLAWRWFFVRYADPHHHLRLRFEGDPQRLWTEVLPRLQAAVAPLLADGRAWKVQLDTYEREIERYGGPAGTQLCEQLFHHDSEAAVELLRLPDEDGRGERRWRLALLGMDWLLDDLGLCPTDKRTVLRQARAAQTWARKDAQVARRLGAKYRAESAALADLLDAGSDTRSEWGAARAILDRRTERNAPTATLLRDHAAHGRLTLSCAEIAVSLLHMHANRLLRSAQSAQEMVLYDFLHRYHEGRLARRAEVGSSRDCSTALNQHHPGAPRK
jgi:thiopeptide-type bacteriocin biosynthesis protein